MESIAANKKASLVSRNSQQGIKAKLPVPLDQGPGEAPGGRTNHISQTPSSRLVNPLPDVCFCVPDLPLPGPQKDVQATKSFPPPVIITALT
jgi:hypothetical protein